MVITSTLKVKVTEIQHGGRVEGTGVKAKGQGHRIQHGELYDRRRTRMTEHEQLRAPIPVPDMSKSPFSCYLRTWLLLRGRGGVVVRLLASPPLGEPGSIPGGFSHVVIVLVLDDAAGRRVFSWISRFPPSLHSGAAPYLAPFSSALKTSVLRAAQISSLHEVTRGPCPDKLRHGDPLKCSANTCDRLSPVCSPPYLLPSPNTPIFVTNVTYVRGGRRVRHTHWSAIFGMRSCGRQCWVHAQKTDKRHTSSLVYEDTERKQRGGTLDVGGAPIARLWERALYLIVYCVLRKVRYWLGCHLAGRLQRADWRAAFQHFSGVRCWSSPSRLVYPWDRGGEAVVLLASHLGEQFRFPAGSLPEFLRVGIVLDDADGRRVFSGISPPLHSGAALYSPRFTLIGSQNLNVKSHPNLTTRVSRDDHISNVTERCTAVAQESRSRGPGFHYLSSHPDFGLPRSLQPNTGEVTSIVESSLLRNVSRDNSGSLITAMNMKRCQPCCRRAKGDWNSFPACHASGDSQPMTDVAERSRKISVSAEWNTAPSEPRKIPFSAVDLTSTIYVNWVRDLPEQKFSPARQLNLALMPESHRPDQHSTTRPKTQPRQISIPASEVAATAAEFSWFRLHVTQVETSKSGLKRFVTSYRQRPEKIACSMAHRLDSTASCTNMPDVNCALVVWCHRGRRRLSRVAQTLMKWKKVVRSDESWYMIHLGARMWNWQVPRKLYLPESAESTLKCGNIIPEKFASSMTYRLDDYSLIYKYADVDCALVVCYHNGRRRLGQRSPGGVKHPISTLALHQGEPGSIPGRATGHLRKWESCRTMPLVTGFPRESPISPPPHSGAAPYLFQSPSPALKTPLLRAAQISSHILLLHVDI
ncbi:hypothetical protein PR048_026159 [Dryococelus australis]|uniref:Uncharacterized protein n=1 Tax=Dryococelus australis TaxID=614101 RepID=A0ABQ9GKJ3_9NEOP|nr:hypothetical protein PR048_026159 [Dryococelus australis]